MTHPPAPSVEWRHLVAGLERLALIVLHHGGEWGPRSGPAFAQAVVAARRRYMNRGAYSCHNR